MEVDTSSTTSNFQCQRHACRECKRDFKCNASSSSSSSSSSNKAIVCVFCTRASHQECNPSFTILHENKEMGTYWGDCGNHHPPVVENHLNKNAKMSSSSNKENGRIHNGKSCVNGTNHVQVNGITTGGKPFKADIPLVLKQSIQMGDVVTLLNFKMDDKLSQHAFGDVPVRQQVSNKNKIH